MINEVTLIGRLGRVPEIKSIPSGTVANVSVATQRSWKDKSGVWNTETEWHNVVVYGKGAIIEKLKKGTLVHVKGRIKASKWTDNTGTVHKYFDIIAEEITILDNKPKIIDSLPSAIAHRPDYVYDDPQDDVPF